MLAASRLALSTAHLKFSSTCGQRILDTTHVAQLSSAIGEKIFVQIVCPLVLFPHHRALGKPDNRCSNPWTVWTIEGGSGPGRRDIKLCSHPSLLLPWRHSVPLCALLPNYRRNYSRNSSRRQEKGDISETRLKSPCKVATDVGNRLDYVARLTLPGWEA